MDFFLIDPTGPLLWIPVNPGEVTIRRDKNLETVNIINLGEVDFSHGEKVREISFSSFLPIQYDPSYCRYPDIPDPQEAMNQLTAWTIGEKPVRFIISDTIINSLVLVSAHTSIIKGGEPGDIYFDLTLRTWREIKVRTAAEASAASQARPDVKPIPKLYEVKSGDSLFAIAKLLLGDGNRWREIYNLNKDVIGNKPELIYPGQKLVMPA